MADFYPLLLSFPPDATEAKNLTDAAYNEQIGTYLGTLSKVTEEHFVKSAQELFGLLDPAVNTIPYLYCLVSLYNHSVSNSSAKAAKEAWSPGKEYWSHATLLVQLADPIQIRYVSGTWRRLIEILYSIGSKGPAALEAASAVRYAILKLDPSAGTFTSNHLLYLRLCHQCRAYDQAALILDHDIHSFPSDGPAIASQLYPCSEHPLSSGYVTKKSQASDVLKIGDIHEYLVLGGMAYIGLNRWKEAVACFEQVLVSPSNGVASGLMLEAYQKWILVKTLVSGEIASFVPSGMNGAASRNVRSASKAYEAIAEDFKYRDRRKLAADVDTGMDIWRGDGNLGLILRVQQDLSKFLILDMHKIYAAIPVSLVAKHVDESPESVLEYLNVLIATGQLDARIEASGTQPVLRFFSEGSSGLFAKSEQEQYAQLHQQIQKTQALAEYVKDTDRRLALTNEYLEATRKVRKNKEDQPEDGGELHGQDMEFDEDLMGDLR